MLLAGSMGGERIKAAQSALLVFLKSLPPGCYFNIVGFGSTFALLFPEYETFAQFTLFIRSFFILDRDTDINLHI